MNREPLVDALTALADHIVHLAADDAQLRSQLRQLAHAVLEATEVPEQEIPTPVSAELPQSISIEIREPRPAAGDGEQIAAPEQELPLQADFAPVPPAILPELTLGRVTPPVEPAVPSPPARWAAASDADLGVIEARCRLKAEGARWAATRSRLIMGGATFSTDIEPMDRNIIAKAKALPDCFLWMNHPTGPSPSNLRLYENVAGCFEAVADVVALLKHIQSEPDLHRGEFERSLDLLAEAQSALRVAIDIMDGPTDTDQAQVYDWLRTTASENQIFIQRYMRVNDVPDPSQWDDLSSRIEAVDAAMQETRKRAKHRRKLLGKVRHKLSLIAEEPDGAEEHWRILASTVDEMVNDGLPPSNRELRELLAPAVEDGFPELAEVPKGFELVLREIDRFLATCPPTETTSITQPTPEVLEVARLLKGKSMVVIGGERRPGSYQALKNTFKLRDLFWIETRGHESIDGFEPYVARSEVAVVVLAIRWSSHSFGEVRDFCNRYGKPLVRLPGGYNPNQVAAQIMGQCSERLKGEDQGASD